jgi:hypothetical protein
MHLTQTFACTWRHSRSCSRLCQRVLPVLQHLTSAHLSSLVCSVCLLISCVINIDTRLSHLTQTFACTWRHSRSCSRLCHRALTVFQHLTSAHLSFLVVVCVCQLMRDEYRHTNDTSITDLCLQLTAFYIVFKTVSPCFACVSASSIGTP